MHNKYSLYVNCLRDFQLWPKVFVIRPLKSLHATYPCPGSPILRLLITPSYCDGQHFDRLEQDCSISSALAMEMLQFCVKPSICILISRIPWYYSRRKKCKTVIQYLTNTYTQWEVGNKRCNGNQSQRLNTPANYPSWENDLILGNSLQ